MAYRQTEGVCRDSKSKRRGGVEATGNVRLFLAALKERGCRVVVVNPHQFQVTSRSVKKTDEQDAKVLAKPGEAFCCQQSAMLRISPMKASWRRILESFPGSGLLNRESKAIYTK